MDAIKTGHFIREQRKKLGLSQLKLAEMLYVEPQTISKWERGLGLPDYDNVERLKEIFGCSLSDILEPTDEGEDLVEVEENGTNSTNLPVLVEILSEDKKKKFSLFDFINKKKIKDTIGRIFGYEYENTYNEKFLFKDVFKKRSKEEVEATITQGMFKGKAHHRKIGIEAPWLYMRTFFFMLICTAISLIFTAISGSPIAFIVVGGLCAVIPLMVFLFETNFSRNLTILDVGKLFLIGGLSSLIITLLFNIPFSYAGDVVSAIVLAPILEELAKAIIVISFVVKIKPKNMLTGLLIGFCVGAGFEVFETFNYAFNSYLSEFISTGNLISASELSLATLIARTFWSFFSGHHYFTAIFGAIYVLFKKNTEFDFKDIFQWKVIVGYLIPVILHMSWNASAFIESYFINLTIHLLICALCVLALIFLINIGINQTRVMGIYENYRTESTIDEEDIE